MICFLLYVIFYPTNILELSYKTGSHLLLYMFFLDYNLSKKNIYNIIMCLTDPNQDVLDFCTNREAIEIVF